MRHDEIDSPREIRIVVPDVPHFRGGDGHVRGREFPHPAQIVQQLRFRQDLRGNHFVADDERLHESVYGHLNRHGDLLLVRYVIGREIDALGDADPETLREVGDVRLRVGRAVGADALRDLAEEAEILFDMLDARDDRRLVLRTLAVAERTVAQAVGGKAGRGCLRAGYGRIHRQLKADRC